MDCLNVCALTVVTHTQAALSIKQKAFSERDGSIGGCVGRAGERSVTLTGYPPIPTLIKKRVKFGK